MPVINHNWLNSHALRKYPVDDAATGIDDNAQELPPGIILDLHLTWPSAYGQYAFISGITITKTMVSIVFMASSTVDTNDEFMPIGAVNIVKPVTQVQYPILPMADGVGGFIALGDTAEDVALRFSSVTQSRLTSRTSAPYTALPVQSIRRYGRSDGLVDIVKILAGSGVRVDMQEVILNNALVEGIMIQLEENVTDTAFQQFAGPCGGRPESGTCIAPGVETIGGVSPDCDGNINIVFKQLVVGNMTECSIAVAGFVLDQGIGLDEVCSPTTVIERFQGTDMCGSSISESSVSLPDSGSSATPPGSSVIVDDLELPYIECFLGELGEDWLILSGGVAFVSGFNPATPVPGCDASNIQLISTVTRNLVSFGNNEYSTTNKIFEVDMKLHPDAMAVPANGGILLNALSTGSQQYWIAGLDAADNTLKLWRYTGTSLIKEHAVGIMDELLRYDIWYRLKVIVRSVGGGLVAIIVDVSKASDPGFSMATFTISTNKYGIPDGQCGIASNRAVMTFDYWRMSEYA